MSLLNKEGQRLSFGEEKEFHRAKKGVKLTFTEAKIPSEKHKKQRIEEVPGQGVGP